MSDSSIPDDPLLGIAKVTGLLVKLSAGLTLKMWRDGNMSPKSASEFAEILRELARMYEEGDERTASQLWTAANLLGKPAPKG
jgi:hypothetical protein